MLRFPLKTGAFFPKRGCFLLKNHPLLNVSAPDVYFKTAFITVSTQVQRGLRSLIIHVAV